jgi:hypothetical protein
MRDIPYAGIGLVKAVNYLGGRKHHWRKPLDNSLPVLTQQTGIWAEISLVPGDPWGRSIAEPLKIPKSAELKSDI